MNKVAIYCVLVALQLVLNAAGICQTNSEVNSGVELNFSTPGARSLAMGGAFIGLADDATAAFVNPAGLTILARPEISFESRHWQNRSEYADHGRSSGEPMGIGIDWVRELQTGEASSRAAGLSFLSFVYPRGSWSVAFYRHQLASYKTSFSTQGVFTERSRLLPVIADIDLDISNYGVSAGFQLPWSIAVGLGVSYYNFRIDSLTQRFGIVPIPPYGTADGQFFGGPNYEADNLESFQEQIGSSSDTRFNAGLIWSINNKVSLGAVFRQGPELGFTGRTTEGPADRAQPIREASATFSVPDVYGLGLAVQPVSAVTVTLDYVFIGYSSMTDDILNLFSDDFDELTDNLKVDDGHELHLGFEYFFLRSRYPVGLRVGSWFDPDHRMRYDGPEEGAPYFSVLYRPGQDNIHLTGGIGMVIGESLQLDAAFDIADNVSTYSISGVYRFSP
jgi:long-subunit fatty acid transport protein